MRPDRPRPPAALLRALLVVVPLLLSVPTVSAQGVSGPPLPSVSLGELFNGDNILNGRIVSATYFFPGPGPFTVGPDNWLDFDYGGADVLSSASTASLFWNGQPLQDFVVNSSDEKRLTVKLPQGKINPDVNRLELQARLFPSQDYCATIPALRLTVFNTTQVRYDVGSSQRIQQTATADLGQLPRPFVDPSLPRVTPLHVIVPANPSSDLLSDLSTITAELGQAAGVHSPSVTVQQDGQVSPDSLSNANVLFVGPESDLPTLNSVPIAAQRDQDGHFLAQDGTPVTDDEGVVAETVSPWNSSLLVLAATGATEAAVHRAAQTLGSRISMQSLRGQTAFISHVAQSPDTSTGSSTSPVTLAQLGNDDETVTGPGDHHLSYTFDAGRGGTDMIFNLVFSHSPLMDATRSSLRVSLNDSPISATDFSSVDPTAASLSFRLPAAILHAGPNLLAVDTTLYLRAMDGTCTSEPDEQAWTVVRNTSSFQFAAAANAPATPSAVTLASYPYPFIQDGALAQPLIVIPDNGDETRLARLQASLGRVTTTDAVGIPVVHASELTDAQRAGSDLILLGLPSDNSALAQINDSLPIQIDEQQRTVHSSTLSLAVKDTSPLGVLNVVPSPWSSSHAILTVTGTATEGIDLALAALNQGNLDGNAALVSAAKTQNATDGAVPTSVPLNLGSPLPQQLQTTTYHVPSAPLAGAASQRIPLPILAAILLGLLAVVLSLILAYGSLGKASDDR